MDMLQSKVGIEQQIERLQKTIRENHQNATNEKIARLNDAVSKKKSNKEQKQKAADDLAVKLKKQTQNIAQMELEKRKAEQETKKYELKWYDFLGVGSLEWKLLNSIYITIKEIDAKIQQAQKAYGELKEKYDSAVEMMEIFENQVQSIMSEIENERMAANQQLEVLLNQDPDLVKLRARRETSTLLGHAIHFIHLFTASLFLLIAAKTGLRALQLRGLLKPHTLVAP